MGLPVSVLKFCIKMSSACKTENYTNNTAHRECAMLLYNLFIILKTKEKIKTYFYVFSVCGRFFSDVDLTSATLSVSLNCKCRAQLSHPALTVCL